MECWRANRQWLKIDSKNEMFCAWCRSGSLCSKKCNTFIFGCRNFQTLTLERHLALHSHKEALQDIDLRADRENLTMNAVIKKTESLSRASSHKVAWKEYCVEYWLKELQESMDRCTGHPNIIEILLKWH